MKALEFKVSIFQGWLAGGGCGKVLKMDVVGNHLGREKEWMFKINNPECGKKGLLR